MTESLQGSVEGSVKRFPPYGLLRDETGLDGESGYLGRNLSGRNAREPRIGSLFSGYGGLDMGVQAVIGGQVAWHCEIDPGASKILARHFPDVPNLGDITAVDWSAVEPVDVLTGGFPCQDVSAAGKRAGLRPGTRSGLWSQFAYAISQLHPSLVVIENVRGLLSAGAHSDLEPCPWCLGDSEPLALRALGAVLGDLADIGYDAAWHGLRAADVGAPHGRFRVFVVAWPAGADSDGCRLGPDLDDLRAGQPDAHRGTPAHADRSGREARSGRPGTGDAGRLQPVVGGGTAWGPCEPAVRRWERVLGRLAPAPTELSAKGSPRLSPAFVEFLMGLPAGWVTDVPGLSRNEQLKALGNGVVPQQAGEALRLLLPDVEAVA